jgi:predicted LPLAT superfamily acyltransferase
MTNGKSRNTFADLPSNGIISFSDLMTAATLIMCTLIALVLPRKLWLRASRGCANAHMALSAPDLDATASVLRGEGLEVSAAGLGRDLLSGNYFEYIETMSEYLGYDGKSTVTVEGLANVNQALESGRGVILWHSAFRGAALLEKRAYKSGNLSVTHLRSYIHPFSATAFGLKFLNPIKTQVENRYLETVVTLAPSTERAALQQLKQALKDHKIVSITAIGSGKNALEVPLLGGNLMLARGVSALAHATGAAVIPTCTSIESGSRCVVTFELPLNVDYGHSKAEFSENLAKGYADRLERLVRQNPGSWRGWTMSHTWRQNRGDKTRRQ